MGAEFSIEYDQVVNAANTYAQSSSTFQQMIGVLQNLADQLKGTWLVGQAGNASAEAVERMVARLNQLIAFSNELRQDLLTSVGDIRDDVDPGMAARFDN